MALGLLPYLLLFYFVFFVFIFVLLRIIFSIKKTTSPLAHKKTSIRSRPTKVDYRLSHPFSLLFIILGILSLIQLALNRGLFGYDFSSVGIGFIASDGDWTSLYIGIFFILACIPAMMLELLFPKFFSVKIRSKKYYPKEESHAYKIAKRKLLTKSLLLYILYALLVETLTLFAQTYEHGLFTILFIPLMPIFILGLELTVIVLICLFILSYIYEKRHAKPEYRYQKANR